jgi:hypothetical protein
LLLHLLFLTKTLKIMRLKFLLAFLMAFGLLHAQEPYRNLIISEASLGARPMAYVELTNKGNVTINLKDFELGKVTPWTGRIGYVSGEPLPPIENWFNVPANERMRLPDVELAPGESWVIASIGDWRMQMEKIDPWLYRWRESPLGMYAVADYHMHYPELPATPPAIDRVDPMYRVLEVWNGRDCFYIRHHFINGEGEKDSVVIDQVGGVFDDVNGTNLDRAYSVAGIPNATNTHHLLRKATVNQGSLDFFNGRGASLEDSEWMPMRRFSARHPIQWYTGAHGPFVLDANTLRPKAGSGVTVDFNASKITVPWGIQRDDSLVFQFEKTPGMGWEYHYVADANSRRNKDSDSAYLSVRTGDVLRVFIAGNTLQWKDFTIELSAPTADANMVMPKRAFSFSSGWYGSGSAYIDNAHRFRATGGAAVDTIKHFYNIPGIDYATRVDTLFKYLEKAPQASWQIVWVDDTPRADLKHGDILRVTAQGGAVKDYFIKMHQYRPSDNALLHSITWPDIPAMYRGQFGWVGDTIPGFAPTHYSYTIQVPGDVDGFPALVAKPQNLNARVDVTRATGWAGEAENRTVTFTVTAESDTTVRVYTVLLVKELMPEEIQPYEAEPFISEFIFWEQWNNGMKEIVNTGTVPLDLSNYLFANRYSEGAATIFQWGLPHHNRYQLYIPGYKWTSSLSEWEIQPLIAEPDVNINPIVAPGDVFVMTEVRTWSFVNDYERWNPGARWWVPGVTDIDFGHRTIDGVRTPLNPWGEHLVNPANNNWGESVARQWKGADFYIFKILNDSIKLGLKPATDPADFELIEVFGTGDMTDYNANHHSSGSTPMITSLTRKPHIHFPRPEFKGSFGTSLEDGEWNYTDEPYWIAQNAGWPQQILFVSLGLGSHGFEAPTHYKSTVTSSVYLVSPGYLDEEIRGTVTGTTVEQFLANISKAHPDQVLEVMSGTSVLQPTDVVSNGDVLKVTSANGDNTTLYSLVVTDEGLRSNAILTSTQYTIEVNGTTGTISGFDPGTTVRTVRNGVIVPGGAKLTIVDDKDRYVPLQKPNFDTIYVDVQATDKIFFEVIAENGTTRVLYQLVPTSDPDDAYVFSDIYSVNQELYVISLVPVGTSVSGLLANLTPSAGATMKVVDKNNMDREKGVIYRDDRVVVTSANGEHSNLYYLAMLRLQQYFAYLVSPKYDVDQFQLKVTVVEQEYPTVAQVRANLELAPGATMQVTDNAGAAKGDSDLIADGDIIVVTSQDGNLVTSYTVTVIISSVTEPASGIRLYPNPSDGVVFMDGLEIGTRIQVYNIVGVPVFTKVVQNSNEVLSLENQPAGLYFVIVSDNKAVLQRFRLVLK